MSKFNQTTQGNRRTTNEAGGPAYKMAEKEQLVSMVLTSMINEKKYYGDTTETIVDLTRTILGKDPEFVANLAAYARNVFHMRSVSHVLVTELANHEKGKPFAKQAVQRVVQRVDDITEILSYQLSVFGKPIPNSLKRGLALAFRQFDEYQLAKYNRSGKAVTLKDVLMLVHPKAKDADQNAVWKRLLEDQLKVPFTWEAQLSTRGNKKEVWEELIDSQKVGYMALLRNLRNIINSGATNVDQVYNVLRDPEQVKKSKQLPFRFFSAYCVAEKELKNSGSKVLDVLNDAIEASVSNMPTLKGKTFIASDMSGSMTWYKVSKDSTVHCGHIAALMMAMAHSFCEDSITSVYATSFEVVNASTRSGILDNMNKFLKTPVGGGTHLHLAIEYLLKNNIHVDRILVFSDEETYGGSAQSLLQQYREKINPDVWVHSVNLNSYGTQQFIGERVNLLGGWSDKVLEFISMAEKGMGNLVKTIENYE